jgi:hypothetical protein
VRFVVLEHESPRGRHWDLLLEQGGVLRTWRLPDPPQETAPMPCESLPDHRLLYLDYEGELSGGRGAVTRWDRGEYRIVEESQRRLVVELSGRKLRGRLELQVEDAEGAAGNRWHAAFAPAE